MMTLLHIAQTAVVLILSGVLLSQSVRCLFGWHMPTSVHYDLLNETRPWCWCVRVSCESCHCKIHEFNLDERKAEAFLRKRG
jgi:hypothetical protein